MAAVPRAKPRKEAAAIAPHCASVGEGRAGGAGGAGGHINFAQKLRGISARVHRASRRVVGLTEGSKHVPGPDTFFTGPRATATDGRDSTAPTADTSTRRRASQIHINVSSRERSGERGILKQNTQAKPGTQEALYFPGRSLSRWVLRELALLCCAGKETAQVWVCRATGY